MERPLKILMSAYACEPGQGSEPGVGWNWALQAARLGHDIHVITRANNRPVIEREGRVPAGWRVQFHYVDFPPFLQSWKKRADNYGTIAYYYAWQFLVRRVARQLHAEHRFDIAHHVTFVNDWMPSGLAGLGIPFLWGPVGGSTNAIPQGIARRLPLRARLEERLRTSLQRAFQRFDPWLARTRERARIILTFTRGALAGLPAPARKKARAIIHIGVAAADVPAPSNRTFFPQTDFKILSNGRLVHWKGHDLLVAGFARFLRETKVDAHLLITGTGPFRERLATLVEQLGIGSHVSLAGRLPERADVYRTLAECDLYALLTFRDGPPVALLEAMHAGAPVMCLALGAPGEMVPDEAGFKLPGADHETIVGAAAAALGAAWTRRAQLPAMGEAGRRHIERVHSWERIGDEIGAIYAELVGRPREQA